MTRYRTRYVGPTDTKGARIVVRYAGRQHTAAFDYAATDPHAAAVREVTGPDAVVTLVESDPSRGRVYEVAEFAGMSFRSHCWADGFGTWHVRVDRLSAIGDEAEATFARSAIAFELAARSGPVMSLADLSVRRVSRTSRDGILSTEYVESWPPERES